MAEIQELIDALPYIDTEYVEEINRVAVAHMIRDECERYKPTKNYLDSLPNLPPLDLTSFETELMKKEIARLESGQERGEDEGLSMKRYELPLPPASRTNDINAWNECLDNSYAQLEHQFIRIQNLELMNVYGAEAWKVHNRFLSKMADKIRNELEDLRKHTAELNLMRKTQQCEAGEKIEMMENTWVEQVMKNFEIERTCAELDVEIAKLNKQLPTTTEVTEQ